jgi:hypothetical protein
MSLATLKRKTAHKYKNNSVNQPQFALNGTHRNQGFIGQTSFSRSNIGTPASGTAFRGYGSGGGQYLIEELKTTSIHTTENSNVVKPSVLSSKGMIEKRTQWVRRPNPFSSTKPGDAINQSSANDYIIFKRKMTLQKELNELSVVQCHDDEKKAASSVHCCVPLVKTTEKIGVATSQGDYIFKLIGHCANLDISYIEYNQTTTKRPVVTC